MLSQENLYDVNVVASMLKDWLRNIPDEIFPKRIQAEIQRQCPEAANMESCPPIMQDELSKLPPFNYYLLFAITCHLSLLTSCYDKTKMDFENLCVCIQPSLNLDRFIFKILIKDWRNCWQGCWTEKEYLSRENAYLSRNDPSLSNLSSSAPPSAPTTGRSTTPADTNNDSRTLSSAGSNNPSMTESSTPEERPDRSVRDTRDTIRPVFPKGDDATPRGSRIRAESEPRNQEPRTAGTNNRDLSSMNTELPELSPLKPLSPLNLA